MSEPTKDTRSQIKPRLTPKTDFLVAMGAAAAVVLTVIFAPRKERTFFEYEGGDPTTTDTNNDKNNAAKTTVVKPVKRKATPLEVAPTGMPLQFSGDTIVIGGCGV